ncbi:MAG: hypothetical protein ACRELD_11725 [Longimicrobiales bacterium]
MAETKVERQDGAGLSRILAVVAVVLIAGLLWWLAASSEPSSVQVVEAPDDEEVEDTGPPATPVTLADLVTAEQYVGQRVRIEDIQVANRLGTQAFWTLLPNSVPFLVRLGETAAGSAAGIQSGGDVTVTGTVHLMTDSVLDAWTEAGALEGTQRDEASFATTFLEASTVRPAGG